MRFGRFLLGDTLGGGGMALVFRATDTDTRGEVALKVMLPELSEVEQMRLRFVREAESFRKLAHPNVAAYLGSGVEGTVPYLVLELVEGETLHQMIQRHPGGLGVERALGLMRPLFGAIAYAHSHSIIHRDLKPQNVIVTPAGVPKLLDFGLARADDKLVRTGTGARMGTFLYAPPEQNEGQRVDHRADLYSLGVLAYEALAGRHPFRGGRMIHVLVDQLNEKFPLPSELAEGISEGLDAWVRKLLRRDPAERYQTADEALAALDELVP